MSNNYFERRVAARHIEFGASLRHARLEALFPYLRAIDPGFPEIQPGRIRLFKDITAFGERQQSIFSMQKVSYFRLEHIFWDKTAVGAVG